MTPLDEAKTLIVQIAGVQGTVKERLHRATRRLGSFSLNRIRDLYYADPRVRVSADELLELRRVATGFDGAEPSEVEELRERVEYLEALVRQLMQEASHGAQAL
jgi:hypothetical protein